MESTQSAWLLLIATPFAVLIPLFQTWYGVGLPVLIDFVNMRVSSRVWRLWISLFVCLVTACFVNIDQVMAIGSLTDAGEFALKVSFIFTQAHFVYKTFWEKSQTRKDLFNN